MIKLCERSQIEGSVLLSKLHTPVKFQQIMTVTCFFIPLYSDSLNFHIFAVFVSHVSNYIHRTFCFTFIQHNIPCELTDVNVFNGEHREPKFVEMNPHEEVPILADGSTTVFGGFVNFRLLLFFSSSSNVIFWCN